MPFVEDLREFTERMGCECIYARGHYLFANGGRSNGLLHRDPPTDTVALLTLQSEFLAAKVKQQERLFQQCKTFIATQSEFHGMGAGPAPPERAFEDLEIFQKNVLKLRKQLEMTQGRLKRRRGPTGDDVYQQRRSVDRAEAEEARQRLMSIEV